MVFQTISRSTLRAVGHRVAHLIGECQRQFWMMRRELRIVVLDVVAGFADDLEVADDGILSHVVPQEGHLVDITDISLDTLDGFPNVAQVVSQALLVAVQTGTASASTMSRNFFGRALGVSTSTGTPSI